MRKAEKEVISSEEAETYEVATVRSPLD